MRANAPLVKSGGILSMIATNFDAVFGDAASKGIEFDTETAYEASLKPPLPCFRGQRI